MLRIILLSAAWLTVSIGISSAQTASPTGAAAEYTVAVGQSFHDCENCPELVVIPPGEAMMGSPESERGRFANEGAVHPIHLPHALAIGKYPITRAEWGRFHELSALKPGQSDRDPVVNISWADAKAYTAWISGRSGKKYRLMTEAEYEYAQRAGTTTAYYWGDEVGRGKANCTGCGSEWDGARISPVGTFPANPWGLFDMAGDVFGFVEDCYFPTYEGAPTDASVARESADCKMRALRGGSWLNYPWWLRSAYRFLVSPTQPNNRRGFRVAREP